MKLMATRTMIAIITDFGLHDPFVGIMKGVIANISPHTQIIDINHSIPQGDIQRAAIQLWMAKSYFPPGTIFLVVVDPGVGTERKAVIIEDGQYAYIGPNNGVFTFAVQESSAAWELSNPEYQLDTSSATFHGRDIFAPAAAHAANGVHGNDFGNQIKDLLQIPKSKLAVDKARMSGEIIYSDQFGNLLTSLGKFTRSGEKRYRFEPWLPCEQTFVQDLEIQSDKTVLELPNGQKFTWVETFASIAPGECGIMVGSTGLIEIAAFNNSAQALTRLTLGDPVTLKF
jgi:hypothetical protein